MNCPKCGNPVASRKRYCEVCGTDITVYRRIIGISNRYYNSGLEKAKVNDLSGAMRDLKKSLEFNKKNIEARNLLGLVYYQMGETVSALSEWVISKNFKSTENDADYYLGKVQDNPQDLDNINQAIKKYNLALASAREQNDDLAIIQLKKVVSLHGNFIRAMHLLALLYIKTGDYERARKVLLKAQKIDVANTTTLRYLAEIDDQMMMREGDKENYWDEEKEKSVAEASHKISFISSYREDKPNVMAFVNLLIGVVIGIAVVYYLVVPTMKSNIREEYDAQKVDYSQELSSKSATITQQEKKIDSLEQQVADLQDELQTISDAPVAMVAEEISYDGFFDVWKEYRTLKNKEYSDDELEQLALDIWSLDTEGLNDSALSIVDDLRDDIYPLAARKIYKKGKSLFDLGDYEAATGMLEAAVSFNPTNDAAMYYLGKAYQALEDIDHAVYYYRLMLEKCPNSTLKDYIPQRLHECGIDE